MLENIVKSKITYFAFLLKIALVGFVLGTIAK